MNMKKFKVNTFSEQAIDLASVAQLESFFKCVTEEETVLIEWEEEGQRKAKVFPLEGIEAKLKAKDFSITSSESVKG